jgi:hypothetical protein
MVSLLGCDNLIEHKGNASDYYNDGYNALTAYDACSIDNCHEFGLHQHSGIHFYGHHENDNCYHHNNKHH